MPSLRSSGKILGASVSIRQLAKQHKVSSPITLSKLLIKLGVAGSPEIGFKFGTHNLAFGNFADGVPDWDTFKYTFGAAEIYHELFDPIFGHPLSTAVFFGVYQHYLLGKDKGGLATGFCSALSSVVADNFWTGRDDTHDLTKQSLHKHLTTIQGKLLSRESLLHFHDQGLEGMVRVERSCREIEAIFMRGCSRKTAPLLFFIPAGGVLSDRFQEKLERSHCIMPYRFAYPPNHPWPQLAKDGKTTVNDLHNVELYVWDCNHPADKNCKLVFKNNGGQIEYAYFPGSSTALYTSQDGITLGMMTNGAYTLADHDLPFGGVLGYSRFILDFLLSPADLQFTDAKGLKTGNFAGQIHAEIPGSLPCYLLPRAYMLPSDVALERRITGTGNGQYTYNSITPDGCSVVLQGVNTAIDQIDELSLSPDQTELRFKPGAAKDFSMTIARRVDDQIRGLVVSGLGGEPGREFRFNTSAAFEFAQLSNLGGGRKVAIQTLALDQTEKLKKSQKVSTGMLAANSELSLETLDWQRLDNSLARFKTP